MSVYKVTEEQLRKLFVNMGYAAEGLPGHKLIRRLSSLNELIEQGEPLTETDDLNLRDELLESLSKNEEVVLAEASMEETHQTATAVAEMPEEEPLNGNTTEATATIEETPKAKRGRKPKAKPSPTSEQGAQETPVKTHGQPLETTQKVKGAVVAAQAKIYGFSATQVARYLGHEGFSFKEAEAALAHFGVHLNPSSVKTYLADGKREDEKFGKRARLDAAQAAELLTFKGVKEEKVPEKVEVSVEQVEAPAEASVS